MSIMTFLASSCRSGKKMSIETRTGMPKANLMQSKFPQKLFVTGTDTGVGKSVISAILVAGLKGRYWKPVQSGLDDMTDTQWIHKVTGFPETYFYPETYRLKQPLSPHASAAREGIRIELDAFEIPELRASTHLVVEGAGGIMVPLNDRRFMLDLMKKLDIPVLLVASSLLGTINHTLLSLEQLRRHGLDVLGVVLNGPVNPDNREAIEHYGKINILAEIEPLPVITLQTLEQSFHSCFHPDSNSSAAKTPSHREKI